MNELSFELRARFLRARHAGRLDGPGLCSGRASADAGDAMVEVDLRVANGEIIASAFRAYGCPATIAVADWVCEALVGRTIAAAGSINTRVVEQASGLPAAKRDCAVVVLDAVVTALAMGGSKFSLSATTGEIWA
ncbi:MAG: iron-sulfur cluster assembly scaffold protein [Salinisphaera sp.]|nr:iron-sulfur cluster assembly scaffold protein [Salinisphaera sp.]